MPEAVLAPSNVMGDEAAERSSSRVLKPWRARWWKLSSAMWWCAPAEKWRRSGLPPWDA
jgi:hypothetical protein